MASNRVKLSPSFWSHDLSIPLGSDLAPASLFQNHKDFLVVDIETKTLVDAVGGWKNFKALEVSIACAYDSKTKQMHAYREDELSQLVELCKERLLIGYNLVGFDLPILEKYGLPAVSELDVFDIMLDVHNVSGWKFVKLEKIAHATLGTGKSADGLMAVEWWKTGEVDKIIEYCKKDVEVTRDVFLHGLNKGFIEIDKADGSKAKFDVNWT
ncbi:MAG: ribonuclease H-like domain-containing protein [Oligoflexia bacterium]|nr:ribonuclease H-like domain-containing protein [Oligoflexia bacterium]